MENVKFLKYQVALAGVQQVFREISDEINEIRSCNNDDPYETAVRSNLALAKAAIDLAEQELDKVVVIPTSSYRPRKPNQIECYECHSSKCDGNCDAPRSALNAQRRHRIKDSEEE